jgi:flagellar hook-length control protein FliK
MQNHTLPIQLSPTSVAPPPARVTPQPNSDGATFSQSLNREMAQRQAAAVANKPAPPVKQGPVADAAAPVQPIKVAPPTPPGPTRAEKNLAKVDDAQAPDAPATTPTDDAAAGPTASAAAATVAEPVLADAGAAAAAEGAAAAAPMTDMLALVASYKQLMQGAGPAKTPAAPAETATTTTSVRSTGIAADTQTMAALQSALKNSDDAGNGKQAALATPDDGATAAKPRAAPDLATVATKAPATDAAMSTLRDAAAAAPAKDTAPVTASAFQAQLNSVEMGKTGVTPASEHIPARLGTTAWDNQVSQKVVWMVGGMDQSATLTLNPPDLGPVQVVLNVNNDQATVAFSSATPEVRAALENAMPRLREMLGDAGVTLGEASVSANMPDQRQADTNGGNDGRNGRNNGGNGAVRSGETEIPLPRTTNRAASNDGAVDTFA